MISPPGADRLRVATWNLWWRFGHDPDARLTAIAATLAEVDADVVCLQEVWAREGGTDQVEVLADHLDLTPVPVPRGRRREWSFGNAVLTRHPIVDSGRRSLPAADGSAGPRDLVWAVVDAPGGPWPVITTHLAYRFDESALRMQQLTTVMEQVVELRGGDEAPPVVVTGDLNATPDSDELRAVTGRAPPPVPGVVLTDCWPLVSDEPGHTWDPIVPYLADSLWPGRRLDHVMVSWPRPRRLGAPRAGFRFGDRPVDGVWPSDHLGVAIDLDTRSPLPRPAVSLD